MGLGDDRGMLVVAWNLHTLRDDVGALTRAVADLGADVLCLQEPPRGWGAGRRLRAVLAPAGLTVLVQGGGSRSTAIAARPGLAVTHVRAVRLPWTGRTRRGAAVADVAGVRFVSAHLGLSARDRARHVPHLLALVRAADGPVVLGADFNQPPTGAARRALATELTDLSADVGPTFPAAHPAHRIDAVLGRGVRVVSARTVRTPDVVAGSDHLPVVVEIEVP